ncbi:MAG: hypothetical protein ACFFDN_52415, partial [Candidatus Hodarchaeota archaeon]
IIEKGVTLKYPMEKYVSKCLQIHKADSYIFYKKYGTKFTNEGNFIGKGKKVVCSICSSNTHY